MTKAIGGYVRRCERRYVPPAPDDGIPRCGYCRARLDLGMYPHLCKELTFGTPPLLPSAFLPLDVPEGSGEIMASILGAEDPPPGPPWTHTIRPPQEFYTRSGKLLYWEKPGPAYTLTEGP